MFNKIRIVIASLLVIIISGLISLLVCKGVFVIGVRLSGLTPRHELAAAMGFSVFLFIGLVGTWFEHILPELMNKE